jgi:2-polyprenyl-6-methoxyphenol hydroxylase-like FAD-dependent oxidoreductase
MDTCHTPAGAASPARTDADVVVVGARLAGAATALLLARRGYRVVVVDRAPLGSDTLSTHAFMKGGVMQLQRWGLLDRVVAAGTPPIRQTTIHYGDDAVTIPVKPGGAVDALYAPRRTVIDPILVAAASEAGAEFRFDVTVTDLRRDRTGRVTGVLGRDSDGRPVEVAAAMTVGADGVHSAVVRATGAATYRQGRFASAFVYAHFAELPASGYEWFYRPGVSAGVIPTNDGDTGVWAGVPAERFAADIRRDVEAGFRRTLAVAAPDVAERLSDATRRGPWRSFPGRPGYVRQSWGPGWALVGDAAHFKDPLGAHGMTDAVRDAELLAAAIDVAVGGHASEQQALGAYQETRDALSNRFFAAVDAVASYTWTLDALPALLVELSDAMRDEVEAIRRFDPQPTRAAA